MCGASAVIGWESLRHFSPEWMNLAFAGLLVAGGFGITAKNLSVQILSRGMAAVVAIPIGIAAVVMALNGHIEPISLAVAGFTAAALAFARPMLSTKEALAAFNPLRFRRTLLAGSTATAATAYATGGITLELLVHRGLFNGMTMSFGALTLALLATAIGVVRMRAWGVLLGTLTSIVLLLAALAYHGEASVALTMLTVPMLALHLLPILWARYGSDDAIVKARIAASRNSASSSASPTHYRVASLEDDLDAAIDADREELPQERRHVHV